METTGALVLEQAIQVMDNQLSLANQDTFTISENATLSVTNVMNSIQDQENVKPAKTPKKQSTKVSVSWIHANLDGTCILVNVTQETALTGMKLLLLVMIAGQIESGTSSTASTDSYPTLPSVLGEESGSTEFAGTRLSQDAKTQISSVSVHALLAIEEVAGTV